MSTSNEVSPHTTLTLEQQSQAKFALSVNFLLDAPTNTFLGYELMTQSCLPASQLLRSRRVSFHLKERERPRGMAMSSKPRSTTGASLGPPSETY